MIASTTDVQETGTIGSLHPPQATNRLGVGPLLLVSAWCGLVAGLLEVGTIVLRKQMFDPDHLYGMSRHFVWLIPLANLCVFLALGLLGCGVILVWPRRGRWLFARVLCALTLLAHHPGCLSADLQPGLVGRGAGAGRAARPAHRAQQPGFRRFVLVSFPVAVAIVAILGASLWVGDRIEQVARECAALAAAGVAQRPPDRDGHRRGGPPEPPRLRPGHQHDPGRARRARDPLRFRPGGLLLDAAISCNHVYRTMVARALGRLAHAAGPNPSHAGGVPRGPRLRDGGIRRQYVLLCAPIRDWPAASRITRISSSPSSPRSRWPCWSIEPWKASRRSSISRRIGWSPPGLLPYVQRLWQSLDTDRKGAAVVNRELLDWLSQRAQPERPFFAFLNYYDAHYPYQLPPGRLHRFGVEPTDNYQRVLIQHWWELDKTTLSPEGVAFAADAYDDCIADLDEQLGKLGRRTGPARGPRANLADHRLGPWRKFRRARRHFLPRHESLRDRAARPAPGHSRREAARRSRSSKSRSACETWRRRSSTWPVWRPARHFPESLWHGSGSSPRGATVKPRSASPALAEVAPNDPLDRDFWGVPEQLPPLGAVKEKDWSYIRREGDVREELFHLREDPKEQRNMADDPAAQSTLRQMRAALDRLTEGPLLPRRLQSLTIDYVAPAPRRLDVRLRRWGQPAPARRGY